MLKYKVGTKLTVDPDYEKNPLWHNYVEWTISDILNANEKLYEIKAGNLLKAIFENEIDRKMSVKDSAIFTGKDAQINFKETVQKVDSILWRLGYKDGQDYRWSDRDRVLTFKSDEVRKEVAAKIPADLIHAQYVRTIELQDSAVSEFEIEGDIDNDSKELAQQLGVKLRKSQNIANRVIISGSSSAVVKFLKSVGASTNDGRWLRDSRLFTIKDSNGNIYMVAAQNSDEAMKKFMDSSR